MRFAKWLQRKRKSCGYTQKEVAAKLFISQQLVSQWENARGRPNLEMLMKLATLYECGEHEMVSMLLKQKKRSKTH
ncbi:MAG: helix-turn-helix domain-containing protein [Lachnospiraceae bacterium]|nr:helix-turn-helix domain-containing protein [Lachnospiraceae bacterium]